RRAATGRIASDAPGGRGRAPPVNRPGHPRVESRMAGVEVRRMAAAQRIRRVVAIDRRAAARVRPRSALETVERGLVPVVVGPARLLVSDPVPVADRILGAMAEDGVLVTVDHDRRADMPR